MKKVLIKAILSKAGKKNISKLVPRIITDKNGQRMKVWVRPDEAKNIPIEHPKRKEEQFSSQWATNGFTLSQTEDWLFAGIRNPFVATKWRDAGFSADEAGKLLSAGYKDPIEAKSKKETSERETSEKMSEVYQKESPVSTIKTEEVKPEDSSKKAPSWVKPEDIGLWNKVVERLGDKFNYGSATKVFKIYKEREGDTSYGTVETKSKKEIDPKAYLPGGDQYYLKKRYNANESGPTLTFRTRDQAVLFDQELDGQISDGKWENSSPMNHYESFTNVEIKTGDDPGTEDLRLRRHYGFNSSDLKEAVSDRMKDRVKTARVLGNKLSSEHLRFVSDYLMDDLDRMKDPGTDNYYIEKRDELYKILGAHSPDELQKIYDRISAVNYTDKDLSRDLKEIGYVVNGKANEDKRKSKEELDKI